MEWFHENYRVVYIILLAVLLFASYTLLRQSQYDERRRNRFRKNFSVRRLSYLQTKLYNEEYEQEFKRNGLPRFITSIRLNLIRLVTMLILLLAVTIGLISGKPIFSVGELVMWGIVPFLLTPKKPFPLFYIFKLFRKQHQNNVSNEVYQLYNEIKSHFEIRSNGLANTYHIISQAIPYYQTIRTTLEKMLPYLEKKDLDTAWELFGNELQTNEAKMLGVVMKEVEATGTEQALSLLEQKRQEFSNNIYNRYTEQLAGKKNIIHFLVVVGIMMVFVNEIIVFYMWYKDVMSVVNQIGVG